MKLFQVLVLFAFVSTTCLALSIYDILHVRLIGTVIEEGDSAHAQPTKRDVYELVDLGRFLRERSMFARVNITQHWARPQPGKSWRSIDLTACNKSEDLGGFPQYSGCKAEALQERSHCSIVSLEGCGIDIRLTPSDVFVDASMRLKNGTFVLATKFRDFRIRERLGWRHYPVPASGVVLVDLPMGMQLVVGAVTITGDTTGISLPAHKDVLTTDLVLDPAMPLEDLLACKTVTLASEEAYYGTGDNDTFSMYDDNFSMHDNNFREAFFFVKCADGSSSGISLLFYVAVVAVIVLVAGGTSFALYRARNAMRGFRRVPVVNEAGQELEERPLRQNPPRACRHDQGPSMKKVSPPVTPPTPRATRAASRAQV